MKPTKEDLQRALDNMSRAEVQQLIENVKQREVLFYGGILALLAAFL